MLKNIATKMLSKDKLLNIDMLECIRRGSSEILFASVDAVFLIDIPSQIYMISANNVNIAENLISKLPNDVETIVTHDKFTYDLLLKRFNFAHNMICYNTVYTNKIPIPFLNSTVKIKKLTHEYKDIIIENYSKIDVVDDIYIENRLKANVMIGAFLNNNLCGFIGNHTEGSIGMLEIFPQYRGKGIGSALQIAATNDALANNRYAYGQVVEDNTASIALQKRLGFELSKNKVYWLMK
jgi:GNAT superfamily N-acetyltransferase